MMLTLHRFTAMALAIAWVAPVHALCLDGRAPTHAREAATATGVLLVRVLSATPLHEDADDPDGISAIRYRVARLRLLGGRAPATFDLTSENTSARFPMEVGGRYLLYLQRDRAGRYCVDACGNSRPLVGKHAA